MKKEVLDWIEIAKQPKLSESFIQEHAQNFDWSILIRYQTISESLMKKNKHKFLLLHAFTTQQILEEYIEKFITDMGGPQKVDARYWNAISRGQTLSESFIETYVDRINWISILQKQMLSFSFLKKHVKHLNKFHFNVLINNPHISLTEKEKSKLYTLINV